MPAREERINLRARPQEKDLIERAAAISGVNTSQFILSNVLEIAKETLRQEEHMTLDNQDRTAFIDAFLNPSEPTPALSKAIKAHKKT